MESLLGRNDNKQYEKEQKKHKIWVAVMVSICIVTAISIFAYILNSIVNKHYTSYEVLLSNERKDSNNVEYQQHEKGILKYSRDGATGIDINGNILWNGSYDMNNPQADICGNYIVIADIGGKEWYIYNGTNSGTKYEETLSIVQIQVSRQGVVAVVLEDKDSNEIHIYNPYDTNQPLLANIPTNVSEDGYPMDISISKDGKKIVTSYFSVVDGVGQSRVCFYNFDEVGQDKVNRIVGGEEFGNTLVHKVEFINNEVVCILTENGFTLYSMVELPEQIASESFEKEIKSVMLGSDTIGFVLNGLEEEKKELVLYNLNGKKTLTKKIDYKYDKVYISGEEIIFLSDLEGIILRNTGSEKLHSKFSKRMDYVFKVDEKNTYIFINETNIEKIKLTGGTPDDN